MSANFSPRITARAKPSETFVIPLLIPFAIVVLISSNFFFISVIVFSFISINISCIFLTGSATAITSAPPPRYILVTIFFCSLNASLFLLIFSSILSSSLPNKINVPVAAATEAATPANPTSDIAAIALNEATIGINALAHLTSINPIFNDTIILKAVPTSDEYFAKNLKPLATFSTAIAKSVPIVTAILSIVSEFFANDLLRSPNCCFNCAKKPASKRTLLKLKTLSPIIERVPPNVFANSSVAPSNLPPLPNTLSKAATVSSTDTVAPALKPSISLTPLSLNKSAADIPALNDLWICSAVVLKSSPVTAATLPVIFIKFASSSASSLTTANTPEPLCISSREKGTLDANFAISSKAFAPSFAEPNKNFNWTCRFSICLPVLTIFLITRPAPNPIKALCKLKTEFFNLAKLPCKPCNARFDLSFATMSIFNFCAI